jgi:hypothetical protein
VFRNRILIGLIVALGGPQVGKGIVDIIDWVLGHKDRTAELSLKILEDDEERTVSLDPVRGMAS